MARVELDTLEDGLTGSVVTPGDPGYDDARRVWNAAIDRRPAAVVECAGPEDVVAAIGYARRHGLDVAVRGGGHSFPGHSMPDGGLVVDLRRHLDKVVVDPTTERVRAQGGALLRDLDAATQQFGLAVPAGIIGHTGVGGLTLGGGMGWLSRRGGLSIDHLVGAQVVTADGRVLDVSSSSHPELLWALRGGGGNFGVVTEFEFDLIEVDPMVQFGMFFWAADQGREALALIRDVIADLPLTMNAITIAGMTAPAVPFVPVEHRGVIGHGVLLVGFADPLGHQEVADRIRRSLPPLFDLVAPMAYVALQQLLDEANAWGSYGYDKGAYFAEISDEMIDVLAGLAPQKNSPLSLVSIYRLDGAYSTIEEDATAFGGGRSPRFFAALVALCPTPDLLPAEVSWARNLFDALRPSMLGDGTYVNVLCEDDDQRLAASYAAKLARLQRVKAEYDPDNVFHHNANIKPTPA